MSERTSYSNFILAAKTAVIASLTMADQVSAVISGKTECADSAKRYCNADNPKRFDLEFDFEMFEGSIQLIHHGLLWKEISTSASHTVAVTSAVTTTEAMKLRRVWAFPHQETNYDDSHDGHTNQKFQYVHVNSNPIDGDEWFAGDTVPLKQCVYVVNLNSNAGLTEKYYTFERIMQSIEYDTTVQAKRTIIYSDFNHTWTKTDTLAAVDFPINGESIYFYPYWGTFYFFTQGNVVLFRDPTSVSTETAYVDMCDRERMYFNGALGSTFETYIHGISPGAGISELDHAFLFDALYVVLST